MEETISPGGFCYVLSLHDFQKGLLWTQRRDGREDDLEAESCAAVPTEQRLGFGMRSWSWVGWGLKHSIDFDRLGALEDILTLLIIKRLDSTTVVKLLTLDVLMSISCPSIHAASKNDSLKMVATAGTELPYRKVWPSGTTEKRKKHATVAKVVRKVLITSEMLLVAHSDDSIRNFAQ